MSSQGGADNVLRGRATVVDVARLAGVSGRTVSRVVAGGTKVSPQTRERVLAAVQTLRFRPNRLARDLRTGGVSTTVGFVVGELSNPFYSQVADGVESVLGELGLTMLLAATRDDPARELRTVEAVLEHRILALLLVPVGDDHAYLEFERSLGTPIVAVDRPAENVDLDIVVFDNEGGAAEAVTALLAAGHRRVAFVGSDRTIYTHRERVAGYARAHRDAGLAVNPEWIRTDAPDADAAEVATRELLAMPVPPTAILAGNNAASRGVLRVSMTAPEPIGFVGFDDFDFAEMLGISVVAHDARRMGSEAARIALTPDDEPDRPTTKLVLPTRLVRRGSEAIRPTGSGRKKGR